MKNKWNNFTFEKQAADKTTVCFLLDAEGVITKYLGKNKTSMLGL